MYDEIIKKIVESIDKKAIREELYPKFSGEGYTAHKISANNFHEIKQFDKNKKITFVDGGNAEIIGSANFSLNIIRVSYATYCDNKKTSAKKFDIVALVEAVNQNSEIHYKTSFFKLKNSVELDEIYFSSLDRTLMSGVNRAEISSVANAIRRFAELKIAKLAADERAADIIVIDGNLQSTLSGENKCLEELYNSCSENSVILSALSKTTSLFTEDGNLLSAALSGLANYNVWFYYPIADINNSNHKAEMFFVKFHDKSKHIFRFEVFNAQKLKAEETINALASNCTDPIFIGYPYGLVEAYRMARISNREKGSLKTFFLVKLKNKNIENYLSAVNAHEILDRVSF